MIQHSAGVIIAAGEYHEPRTMVQGSFRSAAEIAEQEARYQVWLLLKGGAADMVGVEEMRRAGISWVEIFHKLMPKPT